MLLINYYFLEYIYICVCVFVCMCVSMYMCVYVLYKYSIRRIRMYNVHVCMRVYV